MSAEKYLKYEMESAWGFSYAVRRFIEKTHPWGYIYPTTIARHFGVPRIQAELALRLLCQIAEVGYRNDGRYFLISEGEKKHRQSALLQAEAGA